MIDVQNSPDDRNVPIDRVGVSGLSYPIVVLEPDGGRQNTIAQLSLSVSLPADRKGTHMSRFIEVIDGHRGEITMRTIPSILADLRERLSTDRARIEVKFPYFLERTAPASGKKALMNYECQFHGEVHGSEDDFVVTVAVPVNSLCPCSKALSDHNAHNQRGTITIDVRSARDEEGKPQIVWIEELIAIAEKSASAPVYPLLKRDDEKHVTHEMYANPVFVEDMVRNVAVKLREDPRIAWFRVHAENQESIHNHNAFAEVEWQAP